MKKLCILLPFILLVIGENSFSQTTESYGADTKSFLISNKHSVSAHFGFQRVGPKALYVSLSGKSLQANTNISGFLSYQYWFNEKSSLNISVGIFDIETEVSFSDLSTITVLPVLFGYSIYPEALSLGSSGRMYLGINFGLYTGRTSGMIIGSEEFHVGTTTQTVFGVEPFFGIDFFAAQRWRLGPRISYHFLSSFEEIGGGDYAGPSFSLTAGLLF